MDLSKIRELARSDRGELENMLFMAAKALGMNDGQARTVAGNSEYFRRLILSSDQKTLENMVAGIGKDRVEQILSDLQ